MEVLCASLPTELLQAILRHGDVDTVKVARLVCKGWRTVHPRLQPSLPIRVCALPRPQRISRSQAMIASVRFPVACSSIAGPSVTGTQTDAHVGPVMQHQPALILSSITDSAAHMLAWIFESFPGELEQDGRVFLTLLGDGAGVNAGESHHQLASNDKAEEAPTDLEIRGMRTPRFAFPVLLRNENVFSGQLSGPLDSFANTDSAGITTSSSEPQAGTPRCVSPLRDIMQYLANIHQGSLRIQHASAAPAAGLTATVLPCSCGSLDNAVYRFSQAAGGVIASYLPASAAVVALAASALSTAVLPPPFPTLPAGNGAMGCFHCCCGPSAPRPAERHLRAPGLGAVASLRHLRSLELYGVRIDVRRLSRLNALAKLTHLCFDTPLPANRVAILATLTNLVSLHFTITWPGGPKTEGSGEGNGGNRVVADYTDVDATIGDDGNEDENGSSSSSTSSSIGSDGEGPFPTPFSRRRFGGDSLSMKHVSAAVVSLAPLQELTHLRLRVSSRNMGRVSLSPPGLLQDARHVFPRLQRFGFQVLSRWQDFPCTLYNWVAINPRILGGLCCIREPPTNPTQNIFIWQDFDWQLQQPPRGGGGIETSHSGAGFQGASSRDIGSGFSSGGCRGGSGNAADAGPRRTTKGNVGSTGTAAEAPLGPADVAVGIRTSSNSWLGNCCDAATALNAVAESVSGCRLKSLVLQDPQISSKHSEITELAPQTLVAVSELQTLALHEIGRPPQRLRPPRQQIGYQYDPSDFMVHLIQRPSLKALDIEARCGHWLDVVLPKCRALPPPQQQQQQQQLEQSEALQLSSIPPDLPGLSQALEHLGLQLRHCTIESLISIGVDVQQVYSRRREVADDDETRTSPPAGIPHSPLSRLSRLSSLVSLHLHVPARVQISWLPTTLQHLSLEEVTLMMEPTPSPPRDSAPAGNVAAAAACDPLLPQLASLSALDCVLPPLTALLPVAGCHHLTRLALRAWFTECPDPGGGGGGGGTAGAAAPPLRIHVGAGAGATSRGAKRQQWGPGPELPQAVGVTDQEGSSTWRGTQLLLASDLQALVDCCARSLRSLRVTQPRGQMSAVGWRSLHEMGRSSGSMRVLLDALPRLPRLKALCWQVTAELQDRLVADLRGLRELQELTVHENVGRAGQESLALLTGLRSLVQICSPHQARRAKAWMRELADRMPLCVLKCIPPD